MFSSGKPLKARSGYADRSRVKLRLLLLCLAVAALGYTQVINDAPPAAADAMKASLARQRDSIARQKRALAIAFGAYFHAGIPPLPPQADCARLPFEQIQNYVDEAAGREGLQPDLVQAVIGQESGFYPCAVSSRGAQGLMQLMPATSRDLGVQDPFDPRQSIDAGTRFLAQLLSRYSGNLPLALGAYNAGPSVVDQHDGVPPIPETQDYVRSILEKLRVRPLDSPPPP